MQKKKRKAKTEPPLEKEKSSRTFLFTSESVNEGHPDKLCDQISDAVLDACLRADPTARVACETCANGNFIMVFGEITMKEDVHLDDIESIVRNTVKAIGYDEESKGLDYKTMEVKLAIKRQSPEIAASVGLDTAVEDIGAGDQGHVFGYACDETPELMPLSHSLASKLAERLAFVRKNKVLDWVRPDGKTQVTVEYAEDPQKIITPLRVHTVLISTQHHPETTPEQIRTDLRTHVVNPVVPAQLIDDRTLFLFNPSGSFVSGGPACDAGLTGRKIIVDTYGGWGSHGGGAFSGKDPTKVDRSAAYMARHAAKCLVASGLCRRVLVQISYGIGISRPLSMYANSFGTSLRNLQDADLEKVLERNFRFRPGCIIEYLKLRAPIYSATSVYGHFGRESFSWENTKQLDWEQQKTEAS